MKAQSLRLRQRRAQAHRPQSDPRELARCSSVDPERFRRLRVTAGLDIQRCAKLLRVDPRTVRNWEAARTAAPYAAYRLLRLESGQRIPGAAWRGWTLAGEWLISPAGDRYSARDLAWLSLTFRRAGAFSRLYALQEAWNRSLEPCEAFVPIAAPSLQPAGFARESEIP